MLRSVALDHEGRAITIEHELLSKGVARLPPNGRTQGFLPVRKRTANVFGGSNKPFANNFHDASVSPA
jgi:hypothetical protein